MIVAVVCIGVVVVGLFVMALLRAAARADDLMDQSFREWLDEHREMRR